MRSTSTRCRWWAGLASASRIRPASIRVGISRAWRRRSSHSAGRIHEHSEADEFCDDPRARESQWPYGERARTSSSRRTIRWSGFAGIAGATLFQTKLALYTSYVIAGAWRAMAGARRAVVGHG